MHDTVRAAESLLRIGLMPFSTISVSAPAMMRISLVPFTPWKTLLPVLGARIAAYPTQPFSVKPSQNLGAVRPFYGTSSVSGTVARYGVPNNTPLRRRVRLLTGDGISVVRETWSSENGQYNFTGLERAAYVVVAFDHENTYRAVIADRVEAV